MGCGEMPAEVIYGPGGVHTRVSWGTNEDGNVQIVTQAVASGEPGSDPTERIIGVVNGWLKAAGEPTIDLAKLREALPFEPAFDGWWAILDDWGQVNRLIKTLKRARDRQFGEPA
jgi:hypothetical protein